MSNVVAIEFDQLAFPTEVKCEQWLRSKPEYQFLVQSKRWKLKTIARSLWMSSEGRKVFAWHGPVYQCRDIHLERPDSYVLVVTRVGSGFFSDSDIPMLSAKAQLRIRLAEQRQELRDKGRVERKEKARAKKRSRSKKDAFAEKAKKDTSQKGKKTRKSKKVKVEEVLEKAVISLDNLDGFSERVDETTKES